MYSIIYKLIHTFLPEDVFHFLAVDICFKQLSLTLFAFGARRDSDG